MTTRTTKTFEDRLLDELQREIALRAEDVTEPDPVIRRAITTRRALVALAACVAAAGAVVALPSSTGGSQAYAVERNGDGSVTVSMEDILLSGDDQKELSERLRAEGISVTVDRPRKGYVCAKRRGEAYQPGWVVGPSRGTGEVVMPSHAFILRPGDSLVFELPQWEAGDRAAPASTVFGYKGRAEPCREVPWDGSGVRRDSFEEK
ncbi:hypothetical protein [Streptomyces stelliscabiei]|uniref:Uncharacterized protein n=1 Tax=Streptomyces stelliscabiei TaxID=146820 RepID=A0A8I0TT74_9ACTN|nr:hypothetical protein [Streptomyces stelliscabiei]KND34987.1 hypothetical protein IQ64_39340 [Streptomyces stelliscabiei]MBE1599392.1 hypothetical protein [Streptomyces stelliscabiei]MDX2520829.1 hypothetical protein [Streptomyces stelliscabiei]MDX2554028.1 hypothetical protein [Streptomyces stelliscabiei]MDX2612771.1 hypothetical protein [Streptomyces stelliscabiei]